MLPEALSLHEELMLLSLKDEEGTVIGGTMYPYAIGGAVVAELAIDGRIAVDIDSQKLTVTDPTPIGDPLIDGWVSKMASSKKDQRVSYWVSQIAGTGDLKHRVAMQLVRRGILRATEDKVLLVFTRKIYPELDPKPEQELMHRLDRAIFGDEDVTARTAILVALAHHSGLLRAVFDKKRLKARESRIAALAEGSVAAGATKEAISAMEAAMFVATVMPSIVATTVVVTS